MGDVVMAAIVVSAIGVTLLFMVRSADDKAADWKSYSQTCQTQGGEAIKGRDGWHCVAALRPTAPPQ